MTRQVASHGGQGKDTASGGSGRDLYDLNSTAESGVGSSSRDVLRPTLVPPLMLPRCYLDGGACGGDMV